MFDLFWHHFDRGRCLSHLEWDGRDNLKCNVCGQIAAIRNRDNVHVFYGYGMYKDAILEQYGKPRSKTQGKDPDWDEAHEMATNWALPEDPTYIPCPVLDEEGIPFADGFADEDAAAGDFYLGDDKPEQEGEDE
jgi:hypothetical protein